MYVLHNLTLDALSNCDCINAENFHEWCDRLKVPFGPKTNKKDSKSSKRHSLNPKSSSNYPKPPVPIFATPEVSTSDKTCSLQKTSSSLELHSLSSELRDSRRHDRTKSTLTSAGEEALEIAYQYLARDLQIPTHVLSLWAHYRKSSTINQYGCYFKHWVTYAAGEHKPPLPACPYTFSAWLAGASLNDQSASPTEMRCSSVAFFSKIASASDPMDTQIVKITKESIKRKLGFKNKPKEPLQQDQVDRVVCYLISKNNLHDLANSFRIALAYEGTLRCDDYKDMLFGDFILTNEFVRVFLVNTKTDTYKEGQWTTFAASARQTSAYQLLLKLLQQLSSHLTANQIMEWPVMFHDVKRPVMSHDNSGTVDSTLVAKVSYNDFLSELKTACQAVGLNPASFGTHSLRRGSATDQFLHGIPDKVIKLSGRWKSNAFERYIDQAQVLQLQLKALQIRENQGTRMGSLG